MNRKTDPGRLTRAAIHCDAGEVEVRLSAAGNWQLTVRGAGERDWRLACSGDLSAGSASLAPDPLRETTRLGKLLIDGEAGRVFVTGKEVELTALEFGLLATLATEPNRVFTKQELMKSVWGYDHLRSTRTLDTHASRIRVSLRNAGAPGYIVNVQKFGYKLWSKPA